MTFSDELTGARAVARPNYVETIRVAASSLEVSGIYGGVRQVGETAPDFALTGPAGTTVALSELLRHGPVVISFFRGEWCPFCLVELRALLSAQPAMAAQGSTLLLISPERPSSELAADVAALGDRIQILQDPMLGVALSYGLAYLIPAALRQYYLDTDFNIPELFSSGSWLLPLPADFVIGTNGRIAMSFVDVDFTVRLDPAIILETLMRLPR